MKISLIAAPFVEVPPKKYGGRERVINELAIGLNERGSDVSLYCSADSSSAVKRVPICDFSLFRDPSYNHSFDRENRLKKINEITIAYLDRDDSDLISCHDYDNPDLIGRLSEMDRPVVVSIAHAANPMIKNIYEKFKNSNNIYFHGLSEKHVESIDSGLPFIYNGVNPDHYFPLGSLGQKKNYFFSIGDMKPIKGHRSAINLSKESGIPLVIAGGAFYPESQDFLDKEIIPNLDKDVSGYQREFLRDLEKNNYHFKDREIIFVGPASDYQKNILYSNARFSQFLGGLDVQGNIEAFGLTSIESMMAGTPVLGARGGVLEELVRGGNVGLTVSSIYEAIEKIPYLDSLDPATVRDSAAERFSSSRMIDDYLQFFNNVAREYYGKNN